MTPDTAEPPAPDPLVVGLRAGHPDAIAAAFRTWQAPIYRFLHRLSGSAPIAEELVQATFLRLCRHGRLLRADTRLGPWLYTVARNLYRSHRRWSWLDGTRLLELAGAVPAARPPDAFDEVAASEAARRLSAAVSGLPAAAREVFVLVAFEGLSPEAAAEVLEIRPDAARQRLARARAKLNEIMGETS